MKITRRQLKQIIKEELGRIAVNTRTRGQHDSSGWTSGLYEDDESSVDIPHAVFDDVHVVPDDLESLDPHDAYGLGHEAGMEHEDEEEIDDGCGDTVEFADDIDDEGPTIGQMPASWRQILGSTLEQED